MATVTRATIDDLQRIPGKAELIGGRVVELMPTGIRPNEIAANIYVSLRAHVKQTRQGRCFTDNIGFAIPELPSEREAFSPNASYYDGPLPANLMRFVTGPPTVAVEVRSENDYGLAADVAQRKKRSDYFLAGTLVVWDVDPLTATINAYRRDALLPYAVFHKGTLADAEPAVPGWRVSVDDVMAELT